MTLQGDARRRFAARHAAWCFVWRYQRLFFRAVRRDCWRSPGLRHLPAGAGFDE
jgi:hypothetical protein